MNKKLKITLTGSSPDGKPNLHVTNKVPPLKIKTNNIERELDVVISSTADDDKRLLHLLLTKTQESSNKSINSSNKN